MVDQRSDVVGANGSDLGEGIQNPPRDVFLHNRHCKYKLFVGVTRRTRRQYGVFFYTNNNVNIDKPYPISTEFALSSPLRSTYGGHD